MNATRAVGIDLGTTNSVVACLDETGRTQVVRNAEGELVTPSVVFFDKTEIVVGKPSRSLLNCAFDRSDFRLNDCRAPALGDFHLMDGARMAAAGHHQDRSRGARGNMFYKI